MRIRGTGRRLVVVQDMRGMRMVVVDMRMIRLGGVKDQMGWGTPTRMGIIRPTRALSDRSLSL